MASLATKERLPTLAPVLGVLLAYVGAAGLVISTHPKPIVDDWMYIRAASVFADTGAIAIPPASVPVAIFEAVFGGAALFLLGSSSTVLNMASVALAAAAGAALYDLVARSGRGSAMAAFATATFLFAPLFFGLSITFMTDAHAVSLAVVAAALLSRGIDGATVRPAWLVAGSAVASAAYLSRPGALAVIAGAVLVASLKRQWGAVAWTAGIPVCTFLIHSAYQALYGVPGARSAVLESLSVPPVGVVLDLGLMVVVTTGIILVPLSPIMGVALHQRRGDRRTRIRFLAAGIVLYGSLAIGGLPYLGDWLSASGMFPIEGATIGSRSPLLSEFWVVALMVVAIGISTLGFAVIVGSRGSVVIRSAEAGLWACAVGSILLSSASLVANGGNVLDRYLLPVLPAVLLSVATRVVASTPVRVRVGAVVLLVALASLGFVLALDGIRVQNAVFATADEARAQGIPDREIDGGAAWTGTEHGHLVDSEDVVLPSGPHWWRSTFAPSLEPRYVVALSPQQGTCVRSVVLVDRILGPSQRVLLLDTEC